MSDAYATTYHRDGSVTVWDVYAQQWLRTSRPSDRILASLSASERSRVVLHCSGGPALTNKFTTLATIAYSGSVSVNQNRAAHGAVCHLQARKKADGQLVGRHVNSNGRHRETGRAFPLDVDTLAQWQRMDHCSR
jgi:hypothetical protein